MINDLVENELLEANKKHPPFRSLHEGYAVLLEEIEECKEALDFIDFFRGELWDGVRCDDHERAIKNVGNVGKQAIHLAEEAIQVAAMARKFIAMGDDAANEKKRCEKMEMNKDIPFGKKFEIKRYENENKDGIKQYGAVFVIKPMGAPILAPDVEKQLKEGMGKFADHFDDAEIIIKKWSGEKAREASREEGLDEMNDCVSIGIKFVVEASDETL